MASTDFCRAVGLNSEADGEQFNLIVPIYTHTFRDFANGHRSEIILKSLDYPNAVLHRLSWRRQLTQTGKWHNFIVAALYPSPMHFFLGTGRVEVRVDRDIESRDPCSRAHYDSRDLTPKELLAADEHDIIQIMSREEMDNSIENSHITFPIYTSDVDVCFTLEDLVILLIQVRLSVGQYDSEWADCQFFTATTMQTAAKLSGLSLRRVRGSEARYYLERMSPAKYRFHIPTSVNQPPDNFIHTVVAKYQNKRSSYKSIFAFRDVSERIQALGREEKLEEEQASRSVTPQSVYNELGILGRFFSWIWRWTL
ncbi:hypothetical protein NP233_g7657 [Leucocoprinus birnbaumii]|uniref:Uncharacterized protein n=1 Tax=Leucocoprinus birnbaumii TaxID=56174 RepID=A0AAD5YUE4_9AGAR|nr:hypothetical protein NP233_g7657 [Leucocoprinus birnbaumii]